MVPWEWKVFCSIARVAKLCEGHGEQHLAVSSILPRAVSRDTKKFPCNFR